MIRHPLVTRAEAKEACNIRASNDEHDKTLDHLISVATAQLENATGRFFTKQPVIEYFGTRHNYSEGLDVTAHNEMGAVLRIQPTTFRLKGLNIDEDTMDVRYDRSREWEEDSVVDPKDYILDALAGTVRLLYATRESERSVRVAYEAGYEATEYKPEGEEEPLMSLSDNAPPELREACLLQVIYLRNRRKPDNVGLTGDRSVGKGDSFVQTMAWGSKQGITPEALGLVRHLKRPVVGRF